MGLQLFLQHTGHYPLLNPMENSWNIGHGTACEPSVLQLWLRFCLLR